MPTESELCNCKTKDNVQSRTSVSPKMYFTEQLSYLRKMKIYQILDPLEDLSKTGYSN